MNKENVYLPAEWAPQSGIQLTWPHAGTDWQPYLKEITETFLQMAQVITQHEQLLVVTPYGNETRKQLQGVLNQEEMKRVTLFTCPTNDTWARDHGALTLLTTNDEGSAKVLDFKFNGWGEKFPWQLDNAITANLFRSGILAGVREDHSDFVLEGGSIESDGHGTLMTTTSCLLAPHRNQPMGLQELAERLQRYFHVQHIVWLEHGHIIGDDTDGHIDTLVRMAPDDTLLYVKCDDPRDPQYDDLKAMEEQLQGLRTLRGEPYHLLPLPMPKAIYYDGERLPATYANFVILNGAVIVPTYRQPDNDQRALGIMAQAFPDREIVGIDATVVIRQHGSLHCLTMQYPLSVMKG